MKRVMIGSLALLFFVGLTAPAFAHCEMPCGIYGDQMRIQMLKENIATIEKAMGKIAKLSKADTVNYNQLVRWVNTKEHHAEEIQHIVTQYFMTQRVKPVTTDDEAALAAYEQQLGLLHRMLVEAMKAKQTIDLAHVKELRSLVQQFEQAYFGPQHGKHTH